MKIRILALLAAGILLAGACLGCTKQPVSTATPTPPAEEDPNTVTLHLITQRVRSVDGKTPIERTQATYDERGLVTSILHEDFATPDQSYHYSYHYNEHGHLLYRASIADGTETIKNGPHTYNYNPDGTLASIDNYDQDLPIIFEYDGQGNLLKASTILDDGTPWEYASCKYNEAGLLGEFTKRSIDSLTGTQYSFGSEFFYDEQGRLKSIRSSSNYICEYDAYGNIIREWDGNTYDRYYSYSAPDGVIVSMLDTKKPNVKYIFDELGRLIRAETGSTYTEWTYQTITVPWENLSMAIQFYSPTNGWPGIERYYNNILNYLLPKSDLIY